MNINEVFEKINENLYDLENIENKIAMVELSIYQKSINNLKDLKLREIETFFDNQAKIYNQKSVNFRNKIDNKIEKYEKQIERLISAYDNLYLTTFKIMRNAINNQKIAVANVVTLTESLQKKSDDENEIKRIKNIIIACIEKKLNYAVIIDECEARVKWCAQNFQEDINSIFTINNNELQEYDNSIMNKIKLMFLNKIFGKNNYNKFIENFEVEYLQNIKLKNDIKIFDINILTKGVTKQMRETKNQIALKYEETVHA